MSFTEHSDLKLQVIFFLLRNAQNLQQTSFTALMLWMHKIVTNVVLITSWERYKNRFFFLLNCKKNFKNNYFITSITFKSLSKVPRTTILTHILNSQWLILILTIFLCGLSWLSTVLLNCMQLLIQCVTCSNHMSTISEEIIYVLGKNNLNHI